MYEVSEEHVAFFMIEDKTSILKMEQCVFSEMLLTTSKTIWCQYLEDHNMNLRCHGNLKFYTQFHFYQIKRNNQKTTLAKVVYVANIIIHTNLQDPALSCSVCHLGNSTQFLYIAKLLMAGN